MLQSMSFAEQSLVITISSNVRNHHDRINAHDEGPDDRSGESQGGCRREARHPSGLACHAGWQRPHPREVALCPRTRRNALERGCRTCRCEGHERLVRLMPSLDTNVLVRFLFKGDRSESAAAVRLIKRWASSGRAIFVPVTV